MRREYEMSEEQLHKLLDACKPVPYMIIGNCIPRTPQQNANDAWRQLGDEMGFVWDTVQPLPSRGVRFFSAEPKPESEKGAVR